MSQNTVNRREFQYLYITIYSPKLYAKRICNFQHKPRYEYVYIPTQFYFHAT
jgi:hypothetical protein